MLLQHRTILITGASSGIGRELAILLARKGANLVLTGRDHERLSEVTSAVSGNTIVAGLASAESIKALCNEVVTVRLGFGQSVLV